MRRWRRIVAALAAATAMVLGGAAPAPAIVQGQPASDEDYGYVGAMLAHFVIEDVGDAWVPICSGALVGHDEHGAGVFLTAAHCIVFGQMPVEVGPGLFASVTEFGVMFAEELDADRDFELDDGLIPVPLTSAHEHPDYSPDQRPNAQVDIADVGVLLLESDELPDPGTLAGVGTLDRLTRKGPRSASIETVGYGLPRLQPPFMKAPTFPHDGLPRLRASSGIIGVQPHLVLVVQNTSAGYDGGCSGDSGGPALVGGRIAAVESFGDPMCIAWGGKYRVDTPSAHAWLGGYLD